MTFIHHAACSVASSYEPGLHDKLHDILAMLSDHALSMPEQTAVKDESTSLTYRDFQQRVSRDAASLDALIDETVQFIGLWCDPSVDMVCGAWSILAAGRAYLPLAPEYPAERIRYMIEDSGVTVLLTQPHLKAQLMAIVDKSVTVLTQSDLQQVRPAPCPRTPDHNQARLAYMIYTSGSTGKPKGVMVTWHNISSQMAWLKDRFGFDYRDTLLQKTPVSFDAAQWEILAPALGCGMMVGPKNCYRDADAMIKIVQKHSITILQCVPTLLQALVEHPLFPDCVTLKQVFSGGEILTRSLAEEFFQRLPEARLTNLYGPTECTINASSFTLDALAVSSYPDAIAIGHPVADTRYHVLNSAHEPVKPGETGELYISGAQVARGYWRRPDLTREKFISASGRIIPGHERLYRTGDLVRQDTAGNTWFVSRADNQIKLRGYRVELDEIRLAIEKHHWVQNAAVIVQDATCSGFQVLIACIELDKHQAALMDQGNHDRHHITKANKLQVKAQLSNAGCRQLSARQEAESIALPFKTPERKHWEAAFGRKTYRFFEGDPHIKRETLIKVLQRRPDAVSTPDALNLDNLGKLLRYFGQFISEDRLLPKYTYASPGALYATQLYLELDGIAGLPGAVYYYHPVAHSLVPIAPLSGTSAPWIKLHFIGDRDAIEPVYKNNLREVLEMETGHMLGLFDELLPAFGLYAERSGSQRGALPHWYDGKQDNDYLGGYLVSTSPAKPDAASIQTWLQLHCPVDGLDPGLYLFQHGALHYINERMLQKKDVIAINQRVFERAQFGIGVVCNGADPDEHYVLAGREMHRLQNNDHLLGMMPSGYSSKSNHDLPAATEMRKILAQFNMPMDCFYFCIGGPVSKAQYLHKGMNEDRIHMQGPVELLKEDLANQLPSYMIPNNVVILDRLPQTANGKIDSLALKALPELNQTEGNSEKIALKTNVEKTIGEIWCSVMKWQQVWATEDFFASGGNSLTAVALINRINKTFAIRLPLQTIFQTPTVSGLASAVEKYGQHSAACSRIINLNGFTQRPVFCWPGLGGYPLNLRELAEKLPDQRAFFGIQSLGINEGETPLATITHMAQEDIAQIKTVQPDGPYTLWGYSFGARVAFEAAAQLEAQGETVEALCLLAPGAPITQIEREQRYSHWVTFDNPVFVAILFSVFAHQIGGELLERCLAKCKTREAFIAFICQRFPLLHVDVVARIIHIVETTYNFSYTFDELKDRQISAPITIVKALGDNYSFLDNAPVFSKQKPALIELDTDHFRLLKPDGINELLQKLLLP
ncbi:amino acid adenylation domain-containing protein [Erwinia tracheiphila]|nr:amino acid adenylation domain-containing protein [Erwinia tracheiphila]EOS96351.1 amino acid adenylation domain-containing protein [Erwinia tracheiphila PSU-1]UIA86710.1 amino acid adenylation domain-containing protein [Erwinia tracheiphila]UIA95066.1 amino acid adenylation domain-containing protein [Erwinia tracheiphila]